MSTAALACGGYRDTSLNDPDTALQVVYYPDHHPLCSLSSPWSVSPSRQKYRPGYALGGDPPFGNDLCLRIKRVLLARRTGVY